MEISVFSRDNVEIKLEIHNHTNITCKELIDKIDECLNLSTGHDLAVHDVFSLSLVSQYLELPLKPDYKPFSILIHWSELLRTFAPKCHHLKEHQIEADHPVIMIQRNVFLDNNDEEKITNEQVLKLLFEEARSNVFAGKYQMQDEEYLAAIQLRIDYLRTGDENVLCLQYFRDNFNRYISENYLQSTNSSFLALNRSKVVLSSLETKVHDLLKSEELALSLSQLYVEYLKRCRQLMHYGSVFYHGQIEKNSSVLKSLIGNQDLKVWTAVNYEGIHFIDKKTSTLIVSLVYEDFLWELAVPQSFNKNQNALPCLFIEMNDESEKKIMQIFSKQAKLIDNTLREFDSKIASTSEDIVDATKSFSRSISMTSTKSLKKNLKMCSCATFNKKGDCIKKQGSLKFIKRATN